MGKALVVSKTVWVNTILTVLAIIDLVSASPVIAPETLPYLAIGAGVLNVVLRIWFTSEPIKGVFPA
jgi:hypothetical protein